MGTITTLVLKIVENGEFVKNKINIRLSESEFGNFCENAAKNSPPCGPLDFLYQIIKRFCSREGGQTARDEKISSALIRAHFKKDDGKEGTKIRALGRDTGNVAKEIGIPQEELKEYFKRRIEELVQETFGK